MSASHVVPGLDLLDAELCVGFADLRHDDPAAPCQARIAAIWQEMDRFVAEHPHEPAALLKARLHEVIAERFTPRLFPHSPFYFEMGLRPDHNWGVGRGYSVGAWLRERRQTAYVPPDAQRSLQHFATLQLASATPFDEDHRSLGYTRLLREGVQGVLERIAARRALQVSAEQSIFLEAAERSAQAVLRIATRFAQHAEELLAVETDPLACECLGLIAATAARVPATPPRTLYEGLAALWFLREVTATLEGVGISVIGHVDRVLIGLYRQDLAAGLLTEEQAYDLLARWLLPTDIRFHVRPDPARPAERWPETSTCMELGGCDEDGQVVYNELTRLILRVHADLKLLNPKPNCRFDAQSPQPYLEEIAGQVLQGHNVFALQNDDVLIPALQRHGKSAHDARLYVNGGCQETIAEGTEHSAGAYYYFNLPRVLDLCLLGDSSVIPPENYSATAAAQAPQPFGDVPDFAAFYARFLAALQRALAAGATWRALAAARWVEINPCPWYSAGLEGCLENARDYAAGGARYNPSTIAPAGFATLVDSLYAIRVAVYEEQWLGLEELRAVLRRNWEGAAALRARLVALPKFGQSCDAVDTFAAQLSAEIAAFVRTLRNERGGEFQPSLFVYYQFVPMGRAVRATPDGRYAGDPLSQGAGPSRVNPPKSLTDLIRSISRVDYTDHPANAVVDLQLTYGGGMQPDQLAALMRTFACLGGATLQMNCVSPAVLRDAQLHPALHRDLQVRICGLSAYFVSLERAVQDEIISRAMYA
jgi:trans-4-hydroxy-L-proline dehydratase